MGFKIIVLTLVAALGVQSLVFPNSVQHFSDGQNVINEMVYLGTVDGKSFFVDTGPRRNWTEAQALCNRSNMYLASVASPGQAALLFSKKGVLNNITAWYHTGARDSHTITQFSFDQENETAVNPGLDFTIPSSLSYQTCVYYSPAREQGWLEANVCTRPHGTLCQIHHLK